jgi:hypothetical protein
MATIRFKGTVIGNGIQNEGTNITPAPNVITIQGSPFFEYPIGSNPTGVDSFMSNVANVISNLAVNGAVSVYMTTLAADKTAIEAAVTVIAASTMD